ncbi:MAG: CotH kinase family protein [Bacteroidales bacterium]|nr:CotH kinase family protein [Bacteroidales bacterium]
MIHNAWYCRIWEVKTLCRLVLVMMFLPVTLMPCGVRAQPFFPDPGMVFIPDLIPRIDILIHPDSLALIYQFPESDHEYPATFGFDNGIVHDTMHSIGFRLRGNTSRWAAKKSFKVSFNSFVSGRKYYGLEKMNLNGEHNDPSVIRSRLCWDLLRDMDVPAPRSNHVEVYINNSYYGLYIQVEHIDEEFVLNRFGNNDGNLYKCLWPADLVYLGPDPDLYKLELNGRRVYELKTNEGLDDYTDLVHFIDVVNNTPLQELPCALEEIFNVYDFLKVMAADVATADWDGYAYNKNNFYLYRNTQTNRFEYIPYDLDNTFGIDWSGIDWSSRNIYSWGHPDEPRPLFERMMQIQRYRDVYSYYLNIITGQMMDSTVFFSSTDEIRDMIYPFVADDPYYPQDYGYTPADFLNSYSQALGAHVPVGLKPYVARRNGATLSQIILNNIAPLLNYLTHTAPVLNQEIWFCIFAADDTGLQEVVLQITPSGGTTQYIDMADDGEHHDREAGDGYFGASAGIFEDPVNLEIQLSAMDGMGQSALYTCDPVLLEIVAPVVPALVINELMADNESTIADENGEFDDWLEIYNAGSDPVWLGDLYLTDALQQPDKWQLPDYTLAPGAFLLIWADEDQQQGPFHANFKLSKDGEEIGLFGPENMGFPVVDTILFGLQEADISLGRLPDAGTEWKFFRDATPGYSNSASGIFSVPEGNGEILLYPNPCEGSCVFLNGNHDILVFDLSGQQRLSVSNSDRIPVAGLPSGIYFVLDATGKTGKLVIL